MNHIDKIVKNYINAKDTDYAIMIDGQWGAGKSYYWTHTLVPIIKDTSVPDKKTSYKVIKVSLFGIQNVDDLKLALYTNICLEGKNVNQKIFSIGSDILKKVADKFGIPVDKKLIVNLLSLSGVDFRERVLCFDDLERLNDDVMEEVLGYINSLVEEYHLKVVLICNDMECKSLDYCRCKEKLVRYICKLKANIPVVLDSLMNGEESGFRSFILNNANWIGAIYHRAECDNLRILKYNIDVLKRIYSDVVANQGKREWRVAEFVLLLSMTYSIETKIKAENQNIEDILALTQSWANQISYLDSLSKIRRNSNNKPEEITDLKELYLRNIKNKYFPNTFIYGSSHALLIYILTGNYDQDKFVSEVKAMASEAERCFYTDEQKLMSKLDNCWDVDDEDLVNTILEVLNGTKTMKFPMAYYPNFFLRLQKLQNLGFADTGYVIDDLKQIFHNAIIKCKKTGYDEQLNGIYNHTDGATPEFRELAELVYELNYSQRNKSMSCEFKGAILNLDTNVDLNQFCNLPVNLFMEIPAMEFFLSFLKCHNCRKRNVLDFFEDRYQLNEYRKIDSDFITDITAILENYLDDKKIPPSPSKKYCECLLKTVTDHSES